MRNWTCPDVSDMACCILAVLVLLWLLKQLNSWSNRSTKSAVGAASTGTEGGIDINIGQIHVDIQKSEAWWDQ